MIVWLVGVRHLHLSHQNRPAAHFWVATYQFRTTDLDQVRDREHILYHIRLFLSCSVLPLSILFSSLSLSVSFLWEVIKKTSAEKQPRLSTAAQNKLHISQSIVRWCKARKERHYVRKMNKQASEWKSSGKCSLLITLFLDWNPLQLVWIFVHFNEINKTICSNTTSTEVPLKLCYLSDFVSQNVFFFSAGRTLWAQEGRNEFDIPERSQL